MVVFDKPKALADVPFHYCPGCTHGIVHRLVAEAMDALDITDRDAVDTKLLRLVLDHLRCQFHLRLPRSPSLLN